MEKLVPATLLLFLFLLSGCSKDEKTNNPPDDPGPIELKENVHIIDSTLMKLDFSASNFTNGTYVFNASGTPPAAVVNDVIVGAQGEGFIRKITSISTNGNVITYQTEQGTLEDVFKSGSFSFSIDMNDMKPGKQTSGFTYNTSDVSLYQQGGSGITLLNASLNFDPNWFFDFKFTPDGLSYFEISTAKTNYQATANIKLTSGGSMNLFEETKTLATYTNSVVKWIPVPVFGVPVAVPIVLSLKLDLLADYSAVVNGSLSTTANLSSSVSNMEVGMKYENSEWARIYNMNPVNTIAVSDITANLQATLNYALRPKVDVKIQGILGPSLTVGLNGKLTESMMTGNLWDFKAEGWVKTEVNADVTILGKTLANYNKDWETDHLIYQTPYSIQYISGSEQSGSAGAQLSSPLRVKVLNSAGQPQQNVKVTFAPSPDCGSFSPESAVSDQNGFAESSWTIGSMAGVVQHATATAKFGDGNLLTSAPIEFTATNVAGLPVIANNTVISVSAFAASIGAEITSDGGSPVTERGFCYIVGNTTPTINDPKVVSGSGTGNFTDELSGLTSATFYHVRAYATNNTGTVYSDNYNITTKGTWYAGTYTLNPGGGSYSNCGSQQGAQGECYFYIAYGRNITFARSIIPQVADLWDSSPLYMTDRFRSINQIEYTPGYTYTFDFDWCRIYAGEKITDQGTATIRYDLSCDDPQRCQGYQLTQCVLFLYGATVLAPYVGETPPPGLSSSEAQQMINF